MFRALKPHNLKKHLKSFIGLFGVTLVTLSVPLHVLAAATNTAPQAKISFTFDDGYTSALTLAAPTLAKYGLSGTDYVITGCVGMTTAPNTCRADSDKTYMAWDQIAQLQASYGWEIGSHTVTHPYLATKDATDGQPKVLTAAQVTSELVNSKTTLASHGINATDFASPYGDYNNATLAQIAKVYATHRGFADQNPNGWPYNDYLLNDFPVQEGVTVAQVEAKIDDAIANKNWLVLTFHNINDTPSTSPDDYEYSTAELDQIAAYVSAKQAASQIQSIHVNQGSVTSDTNLLPNGSFNDGVADGWTTDSTSIKKDTANNGSYPDPTNSIKLVSTKGKETHLFSPKVAVNNSNTYMFKSFLNTDKMPVGGEVGFYIDEYDSTGMWLSGQYKKAENSAFVEDLNFSYTPSSSQVTQASLQVIVSGVSGINAYLDNIQWFPLTNNSAPVTPQPTDLMTNGAFDAGLSGGWTTDNPTYVKPDATSNGSPANVVNSIKMQSTTKNVHLFSPKLNVDSTVQYTLSTYLNLKSIKAGSVVGFYVDEYDASGNWISGQYKTDRGAAMQGNVMFNYQPSSTNVKQASLQVIVTANSNTLVYVDDVLWLRP